MIKVSVVVPAWNEGESVAGVVGRLRAVFEKEDIACEIIVVDDGSEDATAAEAARAGAVVVRNPTNKGYGYSLLRGIEIAKHPLIAITDADETYPSEALPEMLRKAETYDMVVGARTGKFYHGTLLKSFSRVMFRMLAEFTTGGSIPDINSGLRVFRRDFVLKHRKSISTGYSFTTTITLIALLEGHHLLYLPIDYHKRVGSSKVRYFRDTLRSLQIITEVILAYNPIKFFLLLALAAVMVGLAAAAAIVFAFPVIVPIFVSIEVSLVIFALGCVALLIARSSRQ